MVTPSEPVFLTLLDVMMIVGTAIGVFAVPALLLSKQFRIAATTTLGVIATIGMNAGMHAIAALWVR